MKRICVILLIVPTVLHAFSGDRMMLADRMPDMYIQMDELDDNVASGKTQLKMNVWPEGAIVEVRSPSSIEYETWNVDSNQSIIKLLDTGTYVFKVSMIGYSTAKRTFILKSGHYMEIHCALYKERIDRMISKKPVMYIYSDQDIQLKLKVEPVGDFIYTYPKYSQDGWIVDVTNDSGLSVDGKPYDYLFWESNQATPMYDKSTGFIVEKGQVSSFLEDKLRSMGLNDKESNDFIAYWGPQLVKNDFNYIQFLTSQSYKDQIASYSSSIQFDSELRLFMVFHKTDELHTVNEQNLPRFERKGLTLVEWGGGNVKDEQLNAN